MAFESYYINTSSIFDFSLGLKYHCKSQFLKKFSVAVILSCIIFQSIGLIGFNLLGQLSCKISAASVTELDARVTLFHFTPKEFAKFRLDRKEFKLDNRMYDIVRIRENEDCLEVFAYQDGKEEEILKSLASAFDLDANNLDKVMNDIMMKVLHLTYVITSPISLSFFNKLPLHILNATFVVLYDRGLTVEPPPPKFRCIA